MIINSTICEPAKLPEVSTQEPVFTSIQAPDAPNQQQEINQMRSTVKPMWKQFASEAKEAVER